MLKKLTLTIPLLFLFLHLTYVPFDNNWVQILPSTAGQIWTVRVNPTNQNIIYAGSNSTGIWKSTNFGQNWTQMNTGLFNLTVQAMDLCRSNPDVLYAGTSASGSGNGMYVSQDGGETWDQINTGIVQTPLAVQSVAVDPANPNVAYCAIWDGGDPATHGIFKTTNGGTTWVAANTGVGGNKNFLCIAVDPSNSNIVYAGTSFHATLGGPTYVYKSTNAGATWVNSSNGLPSDSTATNPVRALSVSTSNPNVILAGLFINPGFPEGGGAWLSTNAGGLWTRINPSPLPQAPGQLIRATLIRPGSSTEFYLGINSADSGGVYRTTDAGLTWVNYNGGALQTGFSSRAIWAGDTNIYAGIYLPAGNEGVYKNHENPIGIINHNGNVPRVFALFQNFPNPFNPVTYIQYDIPKESYVVLRLYDITGKEIQTLVNETQRPGSYEFAFDASSLPSGAYFYQITAGDFRDTKKMVLVK